MNKIGRFLRKLGGILSTFLDFVWGYFGSMHGQQKERGIENSSQIPGPRAWPLLGSVMELIKYGGPSVIHRYTMKQHAHYGPIFKEKWGGKLHVFVSGANMFREVRQKEGSYPKIFVPPTFQLFTQLYPTDRGLFFSSGERWRNLRLKVNRALIKNSEDLYKSFDAFENLIDSQIIKWADEIAIAGGSCDLKTFLPDLKKSTIFGQGAVYFGAEYSSNWEKISGLSQNEFASIFEDASSSNALLSQSQVSWNYFIKSKLWRSFEKYWQAVENHAREWVKQSLISVNKTLSPSFSKNGLLFKTIQDTDLCQEEIISVVTDLVHLPTITIMSTIWWSIYTLACYPNYQEKLFNEIQNFFQDNQITFNASNCMKISFLRNCFKEILRLHPPAPFVVRNIDHTFTLGNYKIPKNCILLLSTYASHRDPNSFPNPNEFWPERWEEKSHKNSASSSTEYKGVLCPGAYIPFGQGLRTCVGKKVAETEISLAVAKIVQKFRFDCEEKEVLDTLFFTLVPEKYPVIRFSLR